MKHYCYITVFLLVLALISCRNDFDFQPNTGNLRFSKDTVYLDTVFKNIGSSTYTLKVYNKTNKNISIPVVRLGKGENSNYRLMVDGIPGKVFQNIELLAKDSLFVFIEITSDISETNPTDFLYTDEILFGTEVNFQKVELVTLIQDAVFLYPQKFDNGTVETLPIGEDEIYGFFLDENDPINGNELHFTNQKPYVIYGYAAIPPDKTLVIDAGVNVHFHAQSGIIAANNASLHINGTLENQVIFEGDRLEPSFAEVPGQWGTIWLSEGSKNHNITNLILKNAMAGFLVTGNDGTTTPTLNLQNVQIYNCSNVGILARTAYMTGKNVVINNCGEASIACTYGGNYDFTHCTFANYWASTTQNALFLTDFYDETLNEPLHADFKNCIFYTSSNFAINLEQKGSVFSYNFKNCLIKFIDHNRQFTQHPLYQFNSANYENCLISNSSITLNPEFSNPNKNQLNIGINSAAKNKANPAYASFSDILGKERNSTVGFDIGAYNSVE